MKKYFYSNGTDKLGPFSLEELKEKNIGSDTQIWFEGLDEWKPASEFPELSNLFGLTPPPVPGTGSNVKNTGSNRPPKTWLVESILATLFCCLPFGIAGIVNASKVESRFHAGDIEASERASAEAKKWTTISFGVGLAGLVIYLIIMIIGVASGM